MKKLMVWVLLLLLIGVNGYADSMSPEAQRKAHREEMKKVKAGMKSERSDTAPPADGAPSKWNSFWKKEGERSGMNRWTAEGAGNFFKNLNPAPFFKEQQKRYNDRKDTK